MHLLVTIIAIFKVLRKIVQLLSLQIKFEVASKSAKNGRVVCTVHASHVSCRCPSFKSDKVCKHAVAVAEKSGILRQHLEHICKDQGQKGASRTALAEAFVNKSVAGKKGSTNKFHYRPHNANCTTENATQVTSLI